MSSAGSNNNVPTLLYVFSVVFSVIPTIAVIFRFQSIRRTHNRLHWDDWIIVFALVSCITTAILIIISVAAGGMGRNLKRDANGHPIYDHEYEIFQRMNYGIDLSQLLALGPTKVSVLLLYRRIFGVDGRRFNVISMSLIIIVVAWTTAFFFTNAFQYTPVDDMWTKVPTEAHPTFAQSTQMFLAQSYADVALDVVIIMLPCPLIWKLNINLKRKLQISGIFLLGGLTVGASIARTVVQYGVAREFNSHNVDKTYYLAPIVYWPLIESALGITAACLPLLRPVGQIYSPRNLMLLSSKALSAIFTTSSRGSQKSSQGYASDQRTSESSIAPTRYHDPPQNDKWLRPYNLSVLEQTVVDNESVIESRPAPAHVASEGAVNDGIKYERGYEVSYGPNNSTP
ncbi:hypothetical protein F4775DRAFT_530760 [Biscogniauxia sp. FL1348]|nr:hypothetical protein F4775DRAFT_530760 [Biscogniauxia sp. FL1348]